MQGKDLDCAMAALTQGMKRSRRSEDRRGCSEAIERGEELDCKDTSFFYSMQLSKKYLCPSLSGCYLFSDLKMLSNKFIYTYNL